MTFAKEQLDKMVRDVDTAKKCIVGDGVLLDVCRHVQALVEEIKQSQSIMNRLPKTRDGNTICVGDVVFGGWQGPAFVIAILAGDIVEIKQELGVFYRRSAECYTTESAAEKARTR